MQQLGRYEILRPIASGGMAMVYLGRVVGEGGFQRLLAIKLMHPHLAHDPEFVAMFLDEARLAASIRHTNVVSTLDVQRSPEGLFLVMDYVDGPPLNQLIRTMRRRGSTMPIDIALRIFLDLLTGLSAAHELLDSDGEPMNLIHRDVSPANILLGKDGIARITDFGVARAEARISTTRGGELKGKVPYMAPEQLTAGTVDSRVDIYAAGCVLWEMLVLKRLFRGDDHAQLLAAVLGGPQRSPSEVRKDLPWNIDRACMRALEPLDDRYRNAAAFAEAIEQAARTDGITIAKHRAVGQLVREMVPEPHPEMINAPSGPGGLTPSSQGSMPPFTPASVPSIRHQSSTSVPPASFPSAVSGPRVDTNPTTHGHGSMVAGPSMPAPAPRNRNTMTLVVALGAAAIGGLAVWLATTGDGAPPETDVAAETAPASEGPETVPQPELDDGPSDSTPTTVDPVDKASDAMAEASASATATPVHAPAPAKAGPKPRKRKTPKPVPAATPKPPPPSGDQPFRPSRP